MKQGKQIDSTEADVIIQRRPVRPLLRSHRDRDPIIHASRVPSFVKQQQLQQRFRLQTLIQRILVALLATSVIMNILYHSKLPEPKKPKQTSPSSPQSSLFTSKNNEIIKNNAILSFWKNNTSHQVEKKDRKGRIVHHSITNLSKQDFQGIGTNHGENNLQQHSLQELQAARQPLLDVLYDAGVQEIDPEILAQLPTWEQVVALYGPEPVIYGLDTCSTFRNNIPVDDASIGPAGLFNTGTNPLAMYLSANCIMPENTREKFRGMRWQVPWGKHMLASRKWNNTAGHDEKVNKTNVLPVVLIRDPYSWMQSMCKHSYDAYWKHDKGHCPNLVPNQQDRERHATLQNASSVPVTIKYPVKTSSWPSLAHLWSDWYQQYVEADYPRLMIRFEDLIFHPKELIAAICTCAGAVAKEDSFSYVVDSGKWGSGHGGSSNMISAMIKYGSDADRFHSLTAEDKALASKHLSQDLMKAFQYQIP